MRIYTKTGDDGTSGMFLGGRLSKADVVMEVCGDLDEAVSALGVARAICCDDELSAEVLERQRELFAVAADIAANPRHRDRLEAGVSRVTAAMVSGLEEAIDRRVAVRPLRPVFVVPGTSAVSAALDHARTVVRRAERHVVGLRDGGHDVSDEVLAYVNRLSDLVYVLARHAAGETEPSTRD